MSSGAEKHYLQVERRLNNTSPCLFKYLNIYLLLAPLEKYNATLISIFTFLFSFPSLQAEHFSLIEKFIFSNSLKETLHKPYLFIYYLIFSTLYFLILKEVLQTLSVQNCSIMLGELQPEILLWDLSILLFLKSRICNVYTKRIL